MIELVYPLTPAPLVVGARHGKSVEMLPVCDTSGLVSFQAPRSFCHNAARRDRTLHPVVHMHIITRDGRILLQLRSDNKLTYPGLWDFAVGGHVSYGELVEESLRREALEEIGLSEFNPVCIGHYIYEDACERELVNSFAAVGSYDVRPDGREVSELRFWTASEIEHAMGTGVFTPEFEYEYRLLGSKLPALL